ncbi:class I SAM-dependent methyltransferase [Isoalcanivorax indicus]|uniref:class I SAM-dependent methyltransferase n=1 Tax=Isoalcanivorax indicus TaxID=2202653 RepID=UPI0024821A1A|nr:50S ribosomal protein L11 methyltransferase [Isoalcanivorax indicus]
MTALHDHLQALLPQARLAWTALPAAPSLSLWLLDDILGGERLEPEVINALMDAPPYWSFCWASGQVLADWLLAHPEQVAGRTVLDVGSGSGVVAIAAARAGAARVLACDLDPVARTAIALNAAGNDVQLEVLAALPERLDQVDLLLAADILYDRDNLGLLETFRSVPTVILADSRVPDLNPPGYQRMQEATATTWPDLGESTQFNRVRLFRFPEP